MADSATVSNPQCYDFPEPDGDIAYLCACVDERFVDAFLCAFRKAAGTKRVYFETEAGGALAFDTPPASATLVHQEKGCRIMGWGAHGSACAGLPGESDEALRRRLDEVAGDRIHDFPDATHYVLFATTEEGEDGARIDVEVRRVF